jgi:hypothetical protein
MIKGPYIEILLFMRQLLIENMDFIEMKTTNSTKAHNLILQTHRDIYF